MSNAWIDDGLFGQSWVRLCGSLATNLYLAATCFVHRELPPDLGLTEQELRDELPWTLDDAEFQRALGLLIGKGRLTVDGDRLVVTPYPIEQESQAAQAGRRAKAIKANAAWLDKYAGKRRSKRRPSVLKTLGATAERSENASVLSYPSGPIPSNPVQSDPVHQIQDESLRDSEPDKPARKARQLGVDEHPDRQTILDDFHAAYRHRTGRAYHWTGKDRGSLDRILHASEVTIAVWREHLEAYKAGVPAYLFRDGSAPDVAKFWHSFNEFVVPVAGIQRQPTGSNGRPSPMNFLTVGLSEGDKRDLGSLYPSSPSRERIAPPERDPVG